MDPTPEQIRPDLKPVDPRGSNLAPNDFEMIGAIDNDSTFDAATGRNTPHRF